MPRKWIQASVDKSWVAACWAEIKRKNRPRPAPTATTPSSTETTEQVTT